MKRLLFTAIILVSMAMDARANLISNGSFELGTDPGAFLALPAGATDITDWTITDGGVDYIGNYWAASDGVRSIDLNRLSPGGIEQQVTGLAIGTQYFLSFDMAGNPGGGPTIKTLDVSDVGGTAPSQITFMFDTTGASPGNMGWTKFATTFTALSSSVTIKFLSTTTANSGVPNFPQNFGPALDNVNLAVALPVPAAIPMLLTGIPGIAGISWLLRRSRKSRSAASA